MFKNFLPIKSFKRRGQVLVFYALMIPLLFLFAGVGMDLGWYYLNVSRLQNAADAAAVAGAKTILDEMQSSTPKKFKDYYVQLVDSYPSDKPYNEISLDNGNTVAQEYTVKNLGTAENEQIFDSWSRGKNSEVTMTPEPALFKDGDNYYYVVTLIESIEHFFMPGKFDAMNAPVVAVAVITRNDGGSESGPSIILDANGGDMLKDGEAVSGLDERPKIDVKSELRNTKTDDSNGTVSVQLPSNYSFTREGYTIVSWNTEANGSGFSYLLEDILYNEEEENPEETDESKVGWRNLNTLFRLRGVFEDPDNPDISKVTLYAQWEKVIPPEVIEKLDDAKNENVIVGNWEVQNYYRQNDSRKKEYYERFGHDFYVGAWNHFQDFYHHYTPGNLYRSEVVNILDDIEQKDDDGNPAKDDDGNYIITSYGKKSSVSATTSAINNDVNSDAYNPQQNGILKTYKDGITEKSNAAYPYTWDRLDSINVDFRPEITFNLNKESEQFLSEDYDLELGFFDGMSYGNKKWDTGGQGEAVIRLLRIHTNINFETPYRARISSKYDDPDILWMRIESEPMLYHPDVTEKGQAARLNIKSLNSVHQIIINANQSNYDGPEEAYDNKVYKHRPVIMFYDGPETNDVYDSYKTNTNVLHRKSQPIILNLNAPFRGILYAPNSPVVVIGDSMNQFRGFVVAKNYLRLKNDNDFTEGGYNYYDTYKKKKQYFKQEDGSFLDKDGKKVNTTAEKLFKEKFYYDKTGSSKQYFKIIENTNGEMVSNSAEGITMFVDAQGNVQYAVPETTPTNAGVYDTFGRTDFTTHGYHLEESSNENLLLSGN